MRRKEPTSGRSRDTPVRRSSRLQPDRVGEQVSREPQGFRGSHVTDILSPRESIRAHRKQAEPAKDPSPSPPRGPSQSSEEAEAHEDSRQTVLERDTTLSPFVRLRRLDVPQEEEPSPPQNGAKELPQPNIEWEVVKDKRARLQVLETSQLRSTKARPQMERRTTASSQGRVENETLALGQQSRTGITARSKAPTMKKADSSKSQAGAPQKWAKRLPYRSVLCFLLFLLILGFVCWFAWEHGNPGSFLGLVGYEAWRWSSFPKLWNAVEECSSQCSLVLVESIPSTLDYETLTPHHPSIYQAWMDLLDGANSSVEIAAFYFTLRDSDVHVEDPSSKQGKAVFESLRSLPSRGVKLSISVNSPQFSQYDTDELARHGADVRYVDMKNLTGGILHTKLWVVDRKHIFVGSANMDWRSLTQVKELGAVLYNCSCLARDLHRIFAIYRILGKDGASIPPKWPADLAAKSGLTHPLKLQLNDTGGQLYLSSSPPALCSSGRTSDLTAILSTIEDAEDFVYIAVMDYEPQCTFCKPKRFWPVIDDALRTAACERRVKVRLLISCWKHSHPAMFVFLDSLRVLSYEPLHCPIEVKLFVVPSEGEQPPIPYAHVNHNKYMVTDRIAYIGTSNWSEDYFTRTAGVGLVVNQSEASAGTPGQTLRQQLEKVFIRDWDSPYVQPLSKHWECSRK
ncbi:phospholipase D3-like isoform X1 [Podarcis lilfordi]|uniref:Phospholipase D3-like isoform X1 n=1 Tax=Podarcis lilfordi TaxID=74358 RepID=A0AA35LLV8_9SAUR|nr:phospholipase D3-like isoform X1 [Podarcis lilfordi]